MKVMSVALPLLHGQILKISQCVFADFPRERNTMTVKAGKKVIDSMNSILVLCLSVRETEMLDFVKRGLGLIGVCRKKLFSEAFGIQEE